MRHCKGRREGNLGGYAHLTLAEDPVDEDEVESLTKSFSQELLTLAFQALVWMSECGRDDGSFEL